MASPNLTSSVSKKPFGKLPGGEEVSLYTLINKNGLQMQVMNYGATITSLLVPDKNGVLEDVVLGFDNLETYVKGTPFIGAIVGRYGNRIAKGEFSIDGKQFKVAQNNNGQHLHGGPLGYDKVYWNLEEYSSPEGPAVKLSYLSKDGEEGYPGNLQIGVVYILTHDNELKISYTATTDKKTLVNLTQHAYFNLTGNTKRDILDHQLIIHADKFLPVEETMIPTGEIKPVENTPFDFRRLTAVGARVDQQEEQLIRGKGYDHCWILSSEKELKHAATLSEPTSGRHMDVFTTEPGMQLYSGNFLDGTLTGRHGIVYKYRFGLCLETQHFPDSPNNQKFPSTELSPGEIYSTQTIYRFR